MQQRLADENRSSRTWRMILIVAVVTVAAHFLLKRVEQGASGIWSIQCDASWSSLECVDAKATAVSVYCVSRVAAGMLVFICLWLVEKKASRASFNCIRQTWWFWILLVATLADLATTLWFLHALGVDRELHPGLRLFSYAFGRTTGPILGKALQFGGIVLIGTCWLRYWPFVAACSSALAFMAAIHNTLQML